MLVETGGYVSADLDPRAKVILDIRCHGEERGEKPRRNRERKKTKRKFKIGDEGEGLR